MYFYIVVADYSCMSARFTSVGAAFYVIFAYCPGLLNNRFRGWKSF